MIESLGLYPYFYMQIPNSVRSARRWPSPSFYYNNLAILCDFTSSQLEFYWVLFTRKRININGTTFAERIGLDTDDTM